jgi:hypothetical protein
MNERTQLKPSEQFVKAMQRILSVPKKEIVRREKEYRKQRAASKKSKH